MAITKPSHGPEAFSVELSTGVSGKLYYEAIRLRAGLDTTAPPPQAFEAAGTSTLTFTEESTAYLVPVGAARLQDPNDEALEMFLARARFNALFLARGERAETLHRHLAGVEEPVAFLEAAIAEFVEKGNQDRLALAAMVLSEMGGRAAPALERVSSLAFAGQETFVDLIVSRAISFPQCAACLRRLANSPQYQTRFRLLEQLDYLATAEAIEIAKILSRDGDEEIRWEASNWLAEHAKPSVGGELAAAAG